MSEGKIMFDSEGNAYRLDPDNNVLVKVSDEKDAMVKDSTGRYRKEVKANALRLYLKGERRASICDQLGVNPHSLRSWIHGPNGDNAPDQCFYNVRKKQIEELMEANQETVLNVNRGLLKKMQDFADNDKIVISDSKELKDFAESYTKLNNLDQGGDKGDTQVNIHLPMSVDEAKKEILEADAELLSDDD